MTDTLTTARLWAVSMSVIVYVVARSEEDAEALARGRTGWEDFHVWPVTDVQESE